MIRRLLLSLAFFLLAASAFAQVPATGAGAGNGFPPASGGGVTTPTWVRGNTNYAFSGATVSVTLTGGINSGDYALVCVWDQSTADTSITVASVPANTFNPVGSIATVVGVWGLQMFWAGPITNATSTITVTGTPVGAPAGTTHGISIDSYHSMASGLDTSAGTYASGTTTPSAVGASEPTGTFTPNNIGDLIYACIIDSDTNSTVGPGFTIRQHAGNGIETEDAAGTSTSSQTATFLSGGHNSSGQIGAAFK